MPNFDKELWQVATIFHDRLQRGHRADADRLPTQQWLELQDLHRQQARARHRGWHGAARRLTPDLNFAVEALQRRLAELADEPPRTGSPPASATEIYQDLVALSADFSDVHADFEQSEFCVTTGPIELAEVWLGPFEMRLNWERCDQPPAYRVVALEANPACQNDHVTHPHVSDETVCEGEGRVAIGQALRSGRLGDFFLLVSQLLHTYAPGRAYVELSDWFGMPCSDCGNSVGEDDRSYCHRCDELLCEMCVNCCAGCDEACCSGCASRCASCDERFCSTCLGPCAACQADVCENCSLNDHCPKCQGDQVDEDQAHVPTAPAPQAAVQPDGLGQTPVSA